jgi:hypothetical protein
MPHLPQKPPQASPVCDSMAVVTFASSLLGVCSPRSDVEMSLRMGEATLSIAEELSKYEMMFRRIGVDPEGATAEQVLAACRSQDDVRVEVTRKRNAEEERVAFLQKQLVSCMLHPRACLTW